MFRSRNRSLYKSIILGLAFSLATLFGCATASSNSWHPKSAEELYMITGQATLDALHEYQQYMIDKLQYTPMPPNKAMELYLEDKNKG